MLFDDGASYERLVAVCDPASGLRAVVVIDSTRRGPAFGGIRRREYASEAEAVADARRLARSMARKCALAELPAGGAKTVVLDGPHLGDRRAAYRALGAAIEGLAGRYVCGPDVGTGRAELDAVRERTAHVNPPGNDAGAATAAGVLAGLRAVQAHRGVPTRRVAIQGLGAVGRALAASLRRDGVRVVASDPDPRAVAAARDLDVEIVAVDGIEDVECDVFVPCAMGQGIDVAVAGRLRCAAVCGSANDQLADEAAARALHARGILHAPDIVVSAGAVIEGVWTVLHLDAPDVRDRIAASIADIEPRLLEIWRRSAMQDGPPSVVACRLADARVRA